MFIDKNDNLKRKKPDLFLCLITSTQKMIAYRFVLFSFIQIENIYISNLLNFYFIYHFTKNVLIFKLK